MRNVFQFAHVAVEIDHCCAQKHRRQRPAALQGGKPVGGNQSGETSQPELSGLFHGIEAALGFEHGDPVRAGLVEKLTQFRLTLFCPSLWIADSPSSG
jgi:hypothetical protein